MRAVPEDETTTARVISDVEPNQLDKSSADSNVERKPTDARLRVEPVRLLRDVHRRCQDGAILVADGNRLARVAIRS